ncbi:LacI family DNA-binding transcriptional regulator [Bacillus sp. RAR_GA_16]|uniref:LacI family DNA-binding transcriptional regulator n=1 Tax=Bacillus sp. RAR_GA_16 TaxID=2876774 RepID=UPI001CCCFFE9|nr:LacI family DNA-binding transcriptional regulator [Bacillus sp. RAR_GA_16]MCA0172009.1 LacI family DNA-binding transcriptional regulator [Bacillus sp. RAR_GA_16]
MKDVAREAGVGLGTVSRVLNNNGPVKETTRRKVERAIEALNYKQNEVARNFKMQQSQSIALIVPTIWHPFFSKFAYHVEKKLSDLGYKMILCNTQNERTKEISYISMLEKNKIDGLIAITYSAELDQYISSHLPIVSIDRHFTKDVVFVTSDNRNGGELAAKELINRGCKRIAYLGSVSNIENESMKRRLGFETECLSKKVDHCIYELREPVIDIEAVIQRFLKQNPDVDGFFTMNDKWAKLLLQSLKNVGRRVPEDVQVIGFDGVTSSKEDELTFSTIIQPVSEMAEKAVEVLINLIKEQPVEKKNVLPVTFFDGNSTNKKNT